MDYTRFSIAYSPVDAGSGGTVVTPPVVVPPVVVPPTQQTQQLPSTTQPVAPWAQSADQSWIIGDRPWHAVIAEEPVRKFVEGKGIKNPAELAGQYYSLQRLHEGANDVIALPAGTADQKAWNDFYTKKGRPAEAKDYPAFNHGEGVEVDPQTEQFGRELFHDLGLNPAEAQRGVSKWNEFVKKTQEKMAADELASNTAIVEKMRTEWGPELNDHIASGKRAVEALKLSPEIQIGLEKHLGAAPIIHLLATLGKMAKEGNLKSGGTSGGDGLSNLTPEALNAKIADYREKNANAINNNMDANHANAVAELEKMYQALSNAEKVKSQA